MSRVILSESLLFLAFLEIAFWLARWANSVASFVNAVNLSACLIALNVWIRYCNVECWLSTFKLSSPAIRLKCLMEALKQLSSSLAPSVGTLPEVSPLYPVKFTGEMRISVSSSFLVKLNDFSIRYFESLCSKSMATINSSVSPGFSAAIAFFDTTRLESLRTLLSNNHSIASYRLVFPSPLAPIIRVNPELISNRFGPT